MNCSENHPPVGPMVTLHRTDGIDTINRTLMPNCCRRNTNTRSQSLHFIFDVEHFLRINPSHKSTTIPTNLVDLRN